MEFGNYKWCALIGIGLSIGIYVLASTIVTLPMPKATPISIVSSRIEWSASSSPTNAIWYGMASGHYTNYQLLSTTGTMAGTNSTLITNLLKDYIYYGVVKAVSKTETSGPSKELKWIAGYTNVVVVVETNKTIELSWPSISNQWYRLQVKGYGFTNWHTFATIRATSATTYHREGMDKVSDRRFYRLVSTNTAPKLKYAILP